MLTYETARVCDHENNNTRVLEWTPNLDKEAAEAAQVTGPRPGSA